MARCAPARFRTHSCFIRLITVLARAFILSNRYHLLKEVPWTI
jgi:hypothetical protein